MSKSKSWKRVAAFALALTILGSGIPSSLGAADIFGSSEIVASAESSTKSEKTEQTQQESEKTKHEHRFSALWSSDDVHHWHSCSADGADDNCHLDPAAEYSSHIFGTKGADAYTCLICGHVVSSRKNGAATHKITIDDSVKNGTVMAISDTSEWSELEKAAAKDSFSIFPIPDDGYEVEKVLMNGEQVAINDEGDYLVEMPDKDVVISAVFKKITHQITIGKDIKNGKLTADKTEASKDDTVTLTVTPDNGYVIEKVSMNGNQVAVNDQGKYVIAMPDQDIELYATFAKIGEHDVKIDSDIKNGTVTADKAKAKTGDTIKLTVTPDKGYVIYKVTMNGDQVAINDKGEYLIEVMEDDIEISAEFAKEGTYKLTVDDKIKNGTVKADKTEYQAGDTVTLSVVPDDGYEIEKVMMNDEQVAVNDEDKYVISMPDKDVDITATFVKQSDESIFGKKVLEASDKIAKLVKDDDSKLIQTVIKDAAVQILTVPYDSKLTLQENLKKIDETYMVIVAIAESMRTQDNFNKYKDEQANMIAMGGFRDESEASKTLREGIIEAIRDYKYDTELTLDENKAAVDMFIQLAKNWITTQRSNDKLPASTRVWGQNRYETSLKAAEKFMEDNNIKKLESLVIATGADYADALSAAYLANAKNAPIILTNTSADSISNKTLDFIHTNCDKNTKIYLVGGEVAISFSFQKKLTSNAPIEHQYSVTRLQGDNRYETNLAVLKEAGVKGGHILVASGNDFADALSASATNMPILLVNNKLNKLSDKQEAFIKGLEDPDAVIIGGEAAVNANIEKQIKDQIKDTIRIGGKNRYETSALVAAAFFEYSDIVALAYANDFPDGIVGSVLAMSYKCPIVLASSARTDMAENIAEALRVSKTLTFGGNILISDEAVKKIQAAAERPVEQ